MGKYCMGEQEKEDGPTTEGENQVWTLLGPVLIWEQSHQ